jgi:hypothetical protein
LFFYKFKRLNYAWGIYYKIQMLNENEGNGIAKSERKESDFCLIQDDRSFSGNKSDEFIQPDQSLLSLKEKDEGELFYK